VPEDLPDSFACIPVGRGPYDVEALVAGEVPEQLSSCVAGSAKDTDGVLVHTD
jgi:hypothetical protein